MSIATIDQFAYEQSFLINVGDEKGLAARRPRCAARTRKLALELGTYCGYGALRIARAAPHGAGVLGGAVGGQRRGGPPDLGPRRRRRPGHLRGGHHR